MVSLNITSVGECVRASMHACVWDGLGWVGVGVSVCLSDVYACCVCFYHSVPGKNSGRERDAMRVDTPSSSSSPLSPPPSQIPKRSKFAVRVFILS